MPSRLQVLVSAIAAADKLSATAILPRICWDDTRADRIVARIDAERRTLVLRPHWTGYRVKVSGHGAATRERLENEIRTYLETEI